MGLASQLQQYQQQQPPGQQGGGAQQGAYASSGSGQYPQQQFPNAQANSQFSQQSFQGAPHYQQNQYGAASGQSGFPSIQQGWNPGQQSAGQGQGQFPGQQSSYAGSYPGQQGGFPGQQAGFQGQQGSYQSQQGSFPGQQSSFQGQQGSFPGQQGGFQGQQGNLQGQQGSFPGQQGGFQGGVAQGQAFQQQSTNQAPAASQDFQSYVTSKLQQMVATNRLQAFYPPQRLQQVVNKVLHVDLRALGQTWNMPLELAFDLCTLALYDIAIYADDSTSMKYAEGGQRIKDLKNILAKVTEVATLFDDDGLTVRFMNSSLGGNNLRSSSEATALVDKVKFEGMTPLGTNLDAKIIRPLFTTPVQKQALAKPILVICITDGEPTGEPIEKVVQVIKDAKALAVNSPYGGGAIAFEFAQVGKDQAAQAFLAKLDKHRDIGKMIDATSYFELEQEEYMRKGVTLTPDVWLVKLMVGAVDPTFDEQD